MQKIGFKPVLLFVIGLALISIALSAHFLGLDHEAGWSRSRIVALFLGIAIVLSCVLYLRYREGILREALRAQTLLTSHPAAVRLLRSQAVTSLSYFYNRYRFTFPAMVCVILTYIWFVSAGTWTTWISPTRYYADLARGFQRGNLYLPTRPTSQLMQLSNPYDPATRGDIQAPLDITFYQGRFYLYWGPAPALILLGAQAFFHGRVGDLFLVFGFVCGIFLSQFSLMLIVWDHYFRDLPRWLLFISILVAGLAGPTLFMLDHVNSARIYEAAITGGQFFLIGGLLLVIWTAYGFSPSWRLALTGLLWAFAIGTRITLIVPIGALTLFVAFELLTSDNSPFHKVIKLISLGLPLVAGLVCLGWYNWARFGSVTESGYYYQLAAPNLQKNYGILFHPAYAIQNIYNYFLHPFQINPQFPFLYPTYGRTEAILPIFSLPSIYSAQVITGVLYVTPFVLFAIIPCGLTVYERVRDAKIQAPTKEDIPAAPSRITLLLGLASMFAILMLLFFFWAGMRYSEDFMPALMMLSVIGFWQGYQILGQRPQRRRFYAIVGVVLATASVLSSLLIALSVNDARLLVSRYLGF